MKEPDIKGPVAWQKFGDKWCLTGQYGMRPIFLSTDPKGNLRLRDDATDRLIPFDPSHSFARKVVSALNEYEALCAVAEAAQSITDDQTSKASIENGDGTEADKVKARHFYASEINKSQSALSEALANLAAIRKEAE